MAPDTGFLRTRLRPPALGGPRLRRARLVDYLVRNSGARVVVAEGPGGSGKSSLVLDTLHELECPIAWYSVEPSDDDPAVFLSYLIESIELAYPRSTPRARALSSEGGRSEAVITTLVNDLLEFGQDIRLVLDDIHLVAESDAIRPILYTLVSRGPANLHLYLTTRHALDLPLSRLRARREAVTISPSQLLFTSEEIAQLFLAVWDWKLDPEALDVLAECSGGWVTAPILLVQTVEARWGQTRPSVDQLRTLAASVGNRTEVFDYLADEVLSRTPPEVGRFLKEASILDAFDTEGVAELTGFEWATRVLQRLDREGLFLVYHEENASYRFHHLFGTFLRNALAREVGPAGMRTRHRRAAAWYESRDEGASIRHYILAEAWEDAVRVGATPKRWRFFNTLGK